jgi:hypothetical protein
MKTKTDRRQFEVIESKRRWLVLEVTRDRFQDKKYAERANRDTKHQAEESVRHFQRIDEAKIIRDEHGYDVPTSEFLAYAVIELERCCKTANALMQKRETLSAMDLNDRAQTLRRVLVDYGIMDKNCL